MNNRHNQTESTDPYSLSRFVEAQDRVYEQALAELHAGRKRTHWMWYIFPQLEGLGHSPTAKHYAIKNAEEACAYLNHSLLGPRLLDCTRAVLSIEGKSASEIFGFPDDLKLKSCMTLFASVAEPNSPFEQVLRKYYGGMGDEKTLHLLERLASMG